MHARQLPPAEGESLHELSYEVTFAERAGERDFLVDALYVAQDDALNRAYALRCHAHTILGNGEEVLATREEALDQEDARRGYAALGYRLERQASSSDEPNSRVLFTFSEIVLAVEALRVQADASPFLVKRSLWRPPELRIADALTVQRALRMAGQLLRMCDQRHLAEPHKYFDLSPFTSPGKRTATGG
jgi:hypothetical protein